MKIRLLGPADVGRMEAVSSMLGEAFDDSESYRGSPPGLPFDIPVPPKSTR